MLPHHVFDDLLLPLQKLRELPLPAHHLQQQDARRPHVLLLGVQPVVGLGGGEERVAADDAVVDLARADAHGLAEADELDQVALAAVELEDDEVVGVEGLVRVAELVAELEGEEHLPQDVDDVLEAAQVLVVDELAQRLARDVLQHDVQEVVLAEVLHQLHDIRVVQIF